ncbi:hypothetical protein GALMADRAFT_1233646 [Galerina marginata CBS 339.88]|uniref:Uncharacterized protein n=1 Tax=Galerina marginata (strain CBS 339.88) TaxID=685588 RepID=A0A067THD3_GALM3|nr:hypothetical protein GALMADRAFT_1233646 [Galerina marginata CBS 339.88]
MMLRNGSDANRRQTLCESSWLEGKWLSVNPRIQKQEFTAGTLIVISGTLLPLSVYVLTYFLGHNFGTKEKKFVSITAEKAL